MPPLDSWPPTLKPYRFHGVDLDWRPGQDQAVGECPFCHHAGKFSVEAATSKFRCWHCGVGDGGDGEGGNSTTFLRKLHEVSDAATGPADYDELARDRGLLDPMTPVHWGCCKSALTGDWLVPAYGPHGRIVQLYSWRRNPATGKRVLLATAGLGHGLFGLPQFDAARPECHVAEGPWDGMAWWEALRLTRLGESGPVPTASESQSLAAGVNVLAVPGCRVFAEAWAGLLTGSRVALLFDNDHPRLNCRACRKSWSRLTHRVCPGCGGPLTPPEAPPAGLTGLRRAAGLLARAPGPPAELRGLCWARDRWEADPGRADGYDLRDALAGARDAAARAKAAGALLGLIRPVPEAWGQGRPPGAAGGAGGGIRPQPCRRWEDCVEAWRGAMRWRQTLDDCLSVMLAVCVSTDAVGDQLFLQVVGDAGSGKSRLCDGLLVSKRCYPLEHLTGFHSGWRDFASEGNGKGKGRGKGQGGGSGGGGAGDDYSLLARINHKTLITPEGDVLMSSPKFAEIMSQQRRIFDGTSGASYKNQKEDKRYTGLRTPWIMAGTPALLDSDQSRLGDRFLRFVIDPPDADEEDAILRTVGYAALRAVRQMSNGTPEGAVEGSLLDAYRRTGGYVDDLRANAADRLGAVAVDEERVIGRCAQLARFTAALRARPGPAHKEERHDTQELPTRLTHQFVRLAVCLAVVLNRPRVDADVLRRVRKVALDTARGRTLALCRALRAGPPAGLPASAAAHATGHGEDGERTLLQFLRRAKAVRTQSQGGRTHYRLTDSFRELYDEVMDED